MSKIESFFINFGIKTYVRNINIFHIELEGKKVFIHSVMNNMNIVGFTHKVSLNWHRSGLLIAKHKDMYSW